MSYIKINDILKKRGKSPVRISPAAMEGARIKVLVGSCAHCAKLKDNVLEAAKVLGIPESDIEVVSDLARIVKMGVMVTPSLIVNGQIVSSGKALSVESIIPLLENKGDGLL